MRKIYRTKCEKYKEFKKLKLSYIYYKTLLLSSICNKCGGEHEKIFKEESIEILKTLVLTTNIEEYQKTYNHVSRKHKSRIYTAKY